LQGVKKFRAKIGEANAASINLFQSLGYIETGRSDVFKEITFELGAEAVGDGDGMVRSSPAEWAALVELGAGLEKLAYDP